MNISVLNKIFYEYDEKNFNWYIFNVYCLVMQRQ